MRCGADGTDCAVQHVVPALRGRCTKTRKVAGKVIPYEWYADCPVCHGRDKLTITAKGHTLLRWCQKCNAAPERLTAALAEILPGCFGGTRKRSAINPDVLTELAMSGMPPMSMKLAMLEMTGMGTNEALDKLGVRRENRARVITGRINSDAKAQVAERIKIDDRPTAA